jgi:dTMP kinase
VVLSDRYFLSTVAYQGARGLDSETLLAESEGEFPVPDLVLLLEIDAGSGLRRVAERGGPREPAFEERAFLERVAAIFHGLHRDYIAHIAAQGGIAEVQERVLSEVRSRLALC